MEDDVHFCEVAVLRDEDVSSLQVAATAAARPRALCLYPLRVTALHLTIEAIVRNSVTSTFTWLNTTQAFAKP